MTKIKFNHNAEKLMAAIGADEEAIVALSEKLADARLNELTLSEKLFIIAEELDSGRDVQDHIVKVKSLTMLVPKDKRNEFVSNFTTLTPRSRFLEWVVTNLPDSTIDALAYAAVYLMANSFIQKEMSEKLQALTKALDTIITHEISQEEEVKTDD